MVLTDVRMDTYRAWPEPMGPWARMDDAGVGRRDEGRDNTGLCGGHGDGEVGHEHHRQMSMPARRGRNKQGGVVE